MRFPRSALGLLVVLSAVAAGSAVRIRVAFADPSFDAANPEGLLKSDPALLYYLVSRVVEAGGLPPADFRADPRIEHPDLVDVPATFAVGQEFAIAAAYRLAGGDLPLHAFCVVAMGIAASLAAAGVYGLALALTRSPGGAALATLLFVLLPANYRTIGFVLVREDLAFPAFALHLGLLAGAARVRTSLSFFAAGASLAVALATWHATVFFASLEAAILFAWFLRTGRDPFAVPRAWILPATAALFSLTIPVLSAKGAIVSPPMLLAGALLGASALRRVGGRRRWPRLGTAALAALLVGARAWAAHASAGADSDYGHVISLLAAKVVHLGRLPEDPATIPFDARLLWQGPFATLEPRWGFQQLAAPLLLLPLALPGVARAWIRPGGNGLEAVLGAGALLSIAGAYLVERTVLLPGLLLPVAAAAALRRRGALGTYLGIVAVFVQSVVFAWFVGGHRIGWYDPPPMRLEAREALEAIRALVPEGEAVAADPVQSAAVLAHTRRPILFQPKWERAETRRRLEAFLAAFFHGTPEDLRRLLLERFRCRHLLVDRAVLWDVARYSAGIPGSAEAPPPGTAAAAFLGRDPDAPAAVPGYRLLHRSRTATRAGEGRSPDRFRLYRLED